MGRILHFPVDEAQLERACKRLEADLALELVRERIVVEAFAAVDRGNFDHAAVRAVIRGEAGNLDEYCRLCERISLIGRVMHACGRFAPAPRCTCTVRCSSWPHCAGGPEGI